MKKHLSIFISVLLVLTCIPVFSFANGGAGQEISKTSASNGWTYFYKDSYFTQNASVYNQSLSTMSLCLADAGAADLSVTDWSNQAHNAVTMLQELGFGQIDMNDDNKKRPGMDTMGVTMANKTVNSNGQTFTLLAIVPRSTNYEAEWANNFTMGSEGETKGFSQSAAKIEQFAKEYIAKYSSGFNSTVKVWIVGYSRGAGVANLVAGHMSAAGKIGSLTVNKENIYAYTFGTPAAANSDVISRAEAKSYTNIHNIVASNDMVPKMSPKDWGFFRYGTDVSIIPETRTEANSALFDTMVSYLPDSYKTTDAAGNTIALTETFQAKQITKDAAAISKLGTWEKKNGIYVWTPVDSKTAEEILIVDSDKTFGAVLDDVIKAMEAGIGSRANYEKNLESVTRLLISELLGSNYQSAMLENAWNLIKANLKAYRDSIIVAAVTGNTAYLENILTGVINSAIEEVGIDKEAYSNLGKQLLVSVPILAKTVIADVAIDNGTDLISLLYNIDIMTLPHMPNQCYAWMKTFDTNYTNESSVVDASVTDVQVVKKEIKKTKKVLFWNTTVTSYEYTITPVSAAAVSDISYRTTLIGKLKSGSTISRDTTLSYLYIQVTDANGNVTNWEYKNNSVKIVK